MLQVVSGIAVFYRHLGCLMRKQTTWFTNRSNTNRAVHVTLYRRWQEAGNFGFRKWRNCIIRVAKTKALILSYRVDVICEADQRHSYRVDVYAKLICAILTVSM